MTTYMKPGVYVEGVPYNEYIMDEKITKTFAGCLEIAKDNPPKHENMSLVSQAVADVIEAYLLRSILPECHDVQSCIGAYNTLTGNKHVHIEGILDLAELGDHVARNLGLVK